MRIFFIFTVVLYHISYNVHIKCNLSIVTLPKIARASAAGPGEDIYALGFTMAVRG